MKTRRSLLAAVLILTFALLLAGLPPRPAQALDRDTTRRAVSAVVQLTALAQSRDGRLTPKWTGSGSIVSADGLILTNCHVAFPKAMFGSNEYDYDRLAISLTTRSDQAPQPTYLATVAQYNPQLDLAVVRITHTMDGKPVDPAKLNLPVLPIGDSDELEIGDAIYILGYPGIGGQTITLTSGNVSGFTQERGIEGRAWVKTAASISGGNSGGAAITEQGELVAVPTEVGSGSGSQPVDCRPLYDTNGDGRIDEHDNCIPLGGFINAMRPVNLAKAMIEAARRKLPPQPTPAPGRKEPTPSGSPRISRLLFAPGVTDDDQPVTVASSFPSGSTAIYLFFDYENLQDGVAWQRELLVDGETMPDVWPEARWNDGQKGLYWMGISGKPLPDGEYEFVIYYDGVELGSASVTVGGRAQALPTFRNITFSAGNSQGALLPPGATEVQASFEYANMTARDTWFRVWYYEGKKTTQGQGQAFSQASGKGSASLTSKTGIEVGSYRLELYIGDRLAATADFVVGGASKEQGQASPFGPITFAQDVDQQNKPLRPATAFASGTTRFYGAFDYLGLQDGWEWSARWYLNDKTILDNKYTWSQGAKGSSWVSIYNDSGLPDGQYKLELSLRGNVVQSGVCTVGKAGRATPSPTPIARNQSVVVQGRITDADTGRGIAGAVFLVLQPGLTWDDFQETDEEIYAWAETDRNGNYQLSEPLIRGESYAMAVGAQGYRTVAEDDVTIAANVPATHTINVKLQRLR